LAFRPTLLGGISPAAVFYGYGDYAIRLLHHVVREGGRVLEIPTVYRFRKGGESKTRFLTYLGTYLASVFRLRLARRCRARAPDPLPDRSHPRAIRPRLLYSVGWIDGIFATWDVSPASSGPTGEAHRRSLSFRSASGSSRRAAATSSVATARTRTSSRKTTASWTSGCSPRSSTRLP